MSKGTVIEAFFVITAWIVALILVSLDFSILNKWRKK